MSRGVARFYNWDPGSYVTGVTDANVIGVEGAMWGETVVDMSDVDYMVFPRLPTLAEIGWSPKADRTSLRSPAYTDFFGRLAARGPRLMAAGVNFCPVGRGAVGSLAGHARPDGRQPGPGQRRHRNARRARLRAKRGDGSD
jgi:hypothetical protein